MHPAMDDLPLIKIVEYDWPFIDYSTFKCNPCDRTFISKRALYDHCRHARVHHGQWCNRCLHLFPNRDAMASHLVDSNYHRICPDCNTDFVIRDDWKMHMTREHSQCLRCSYRGLDADDLVRHLEKAHHQCSSCKRVFQNQNNLCQVNPRS
jgi:hypothetical protein